MNRLPLLCSLLALALVCSRSFAEPPAFPIAKVIVNPGAEYADTARSWQGIPGIERAPKGRLWATWYSGDIGEGSMGNYAMRQGHAGATGEVTHRAGPSSEGGPKVFRGFTETKKHVILSAVEGSRESTTDIISRRRDSSTAQRAAHPDATTTALLRSE
jgi:hypothetical protein